jgi:hypothetical protein
MLMRLKKPFVYCLSLYPRSVLHDLVGPFVKIIAAICEAEGIAEHRGLGKTASFLLCTQIWGKKEVNAG